MELKQIHDSDKYLISTCGKVFSQHRNRFIKQFKNRSGYLDVVLSSKGVIKHKRVHRLVAEAFIDNKDGKPYVNHKDGNKINNHADNLEWCTQSENITHSFCTGMNMNRGETHCRSTVSEEIVQKIRSLAKTHTQKQLSDIFNLRRDRISDIVNRKTWKHLLETNVMK